MIGSKGNSDTTIHNNYLTSPKSHGKTFLATNLSNPQAGQLTTYSFLRMDTHKTQSSFSNGMLYVQMKLEKKFVSLFLFAKTGFLTYRRELEQFSYLLGCCLRLEI